MKRITALIIAIMLCFAFSVTVLADNIYIVDDEEAEFVPEIQVTTTQPETTTALQGDSLFGDMGSFEDMLGGLKDTLGGGIDSLLGGLGDSFGDFDFNFGTEGTTAGGSSQLPAIDNSDKPTQSSQAQQLLENLPDTTTSVAESTTQKSEQNEELPSVLIVNNGKDSDDGLSGSTLTLLVFVAAIVILILAAAIILVLMTRRTEYNSSVMDKSTIPSVEKPKAMSHLMNDNISDDGNDYGNITYWND